MKKLLFVFLAIPLLASVNLTISGSAFFPKADYFRNAYGSTIINFAGEGEVSFGSLALFTGVDFIKKQGELTYSKEPVNLTLIPIKAGIRFYFMRNFFLDGGMGSWQYSEKTDFDKSSGSVTGYFAGLGMKYNFGNSTYFRLRMNYTHAKKIVANLESDSSGIQAEVGIGYSF